MNYNSVCIFFIASSFIVVLWSIFMCTSKFHTFIWQLQTRGLDRRLRVLSDGRGERAPFWMQLILLSYSDRRRRVPRSLKVVFVIEVIMFVLIKRILRLASPWKVSGCSSVRAFSFKNLIWSESRLSQIFWKWKK